VGGDEGLELLCLAVPAVGHGLALIVEPKGHHRGAETAFAPVRSGIVFMQLTGGVGDAHQPDRRVLRMGARFAHHESDMAGVVATLEHLRLSPGEEVARCDGLRSVQPQPTTPARFTAGAQDPVVEVARQWLAWQCPPRSRCRLRQNPVAHDRAVPVVDASAGYDPGPVLIAGRSHVVLDGRESRQHGLVWHLRHEYGEDRRQQEHQLLDDARVGPRDKSHTLAIC
jgi:hypothetical protein